MRIVLSNLVRRQTALLLAGAAMLATQPGASCVSDGGGSTSPEQTRSPSSDDRPRDSDEDANYIPQRAGIVAEGTGPLTYIADADGQLYVQDLKDETLLYSRRLTRGQRVTVTPDENRIRVDDDTVSKADLKRDHAHRLYLLRDRRFEDRGRSESEGKELPSGAQVKGQGKNRELSFTTSRAGSVYIYDADARRVVDTVDVRAGQRFVFSPGAGRATVDGKRVVNRDFDTNTTFKIYFAR